MSSTTISRLAAIAAACLLLTLAACEGDRFEPSLPTGAILSVSSAPEMDIRAMAGRALDDLVVLAEQTAIAGHGVDGWTYLGADWLGPLALNRIATNAEGDLAIGDYYGRVFVRQAGVWTELPALVGVRLSDVAIDPDGSIWACGRSEFYLPLLAHWDGAAWQLHQPPEQNTDLGPIAMVGPGDLVIDGSRGLVFRFRGGAWEQTALFTEVHDLWTDGQGEVFAAWLHRVGRLTDDGFVPLDDREFASDLQCIAGNGAGDLAVGWWPGQVAVLRGDAWDDLPQLVDEGGDPVPLGELLLFDDGTLLARSIWSTLYRFDGAAWSRFLPPPPPRRAIVVQRTNDYNNTTYFDVVGSEGIVIEVAGDEPVYRYTDSLGERLDVVDRCRLTNGAYFHITAGGHWMVEIGNERVGSTAPAPHAYRATAAGPGGEVLIVGDAGLVQWGFNGIQLSDGPDVATDLLGIWSCTADSTYWVVGRAGTIARRAAGGMWTLHGGVTQADLAAVWARDDHDVYVAGGGGTVLAWDGAAWRDLHCPLAQDLTAIMGSPGRYLWVCGRGGALAVHDGDRWRELESGYAGDLLDLGVQNFRQVIVLADDGTLRGCRVLDP